MVWHDAQMGPLEVTAGIAAVLIAVVGIWVAAVRRRDRRHRDELERRDLSTALVTLCVGGGMGTATIVERV